MAIYLVSTRNPVHTDPAAVPSTAADADAGPRASAVEVSRRIAREAIVKEDFPALSVAVAVDGKIVWAEGFGFANVEARTPVTPHTRFRTGSVSKTMTAAALGLLYERGRLDLDAPVQTYVPQFPKKVWTITPRRLMGDVAGVHRTRGNNDACPVAIEGAAAEPFSAFVSREVFTPLGMDRTVIEGADGDSDDVTFYSRKHTFGLYQGAADAAEESYSCFFGAGTFLSTPSDLARLGSAMIRPGLLKTDTITLLQTPLTLKSGASTGYALGWRVDTIPLAGKPTGVVRHRANLVGGAVTLSVFPDPGLVVAATANTTTTDHVDRFALQVAEAFARPAATP